MPADKIGYWLLYRSLTWSINSHNCTHKHEYLVLWLTSSSARPSFSSYTFHRGKSQPFSPIQLSYDDYLFYVLISKQSMLKKTTYHLGDLIDIYTQSYMKSWWTMLTVGTIDLSNSSSLPRFSESGQLLLAFTQFKTVGRSPFIPPGGMLSIGVVSGLFHRQHRIHLTFRNHPSSFCLSVRALGWVNLTQLSIILVLELSI